MHVITLSVLEARVEWSAILTEFKWDRNSAHLTQYPIRVVGWADVFRDLPISGSDSVRVGYCVVAAEIDALSTKNGLMSHGNYNREIAHPDSSNNSHSRMHMTLLVRDIIFIYSLHTMILFN
jgi:hypothetical protein